MNAGARPRDDLVRSGRELNLAAVDAIGRTEARLMVRRIAHRHGETPDSFLPAPRSHLTWRSSSDTRLPSTAISARNPTTPVSIRFTLHDASPASSARPFSSLPTRSSIVGAVLITACCQDGPAHLMGPPYCISRVRSGSQPTWIKGSHTHFAAANWCDYFRFDALLTRWQE